MIKPSAPGEAEFDMGGGGVEMKGLFSRSPLSPTGHGGGEDSAHEGDKGVDGPHRPQTGGRPDAVTLGRKNVTAVLVPTSTGTRYGRGLTGVGGGTNRQWGGGTPVCGKCGKLVYFAEQVSKEEN